MVFVETSFPRGGTKKSKTNKVHEDKPQVRLRDN